MAGGCSLDADTKPILNDLVHFRMPRSKMLGYAMTDTMARLEYVFEEFDGIADGLHGPRKLYEHTIAGGLDDAPSREAKANEVQAVRWCYGGMAHCDAVEEKLSTASETVILPNDSKNRRSNEGVSRRAQSRGRR